MKEVKEEVQEVQEQKFVKLPLEIVNAIIGYLGTKPYQESATLISALQENAEILDS